KALADMQTAVEAEPDDWRWLARLGNVYKQMEDFRQAVQTYTGALEIEEVAILYYNRGIAYRDAFTAQDRTLNDALRHQDDDFRCAFLRADDPTGEEHLDTAKGFINPPVIIDDEYEPITDPALCEP